MGELTMARRTSLYLRASGRLQSLDNCRNIATETMPKFIRSDQDHELARQLARERLKRSKLGPNTLAPNDPDLELFRQVLRREKRTKPSTAVSARVIRKLA